jgi:hypothetical protein
MKESTNDFMATSVVNEAGSGIPRRRVPGQIHSSAQVTQARLLGRFQGYQSIGQRRHPANGGLWVRSYLIGSAYWRSVS